MATEGKICGSLHGGRFSKSAMVESLVQPWHQALNMSRVISERLISWNEVIVQEAG